MASTYTSSLRFTKQGDGENPNTWGEVLNGVLDLVDNAVAGYVTVSVGSAATVALTENQGSGDQSRSSMIHFTGSVGESHTSIFAVIPNVPKAYIVRSSISTSASSGTFMLRVTGNTGVTIPAGSHGVYFTDGATVMTLNATGLGFTDIVNRDVGVCTTNVPDTSLADLRYVRASVSSTIIADKHFVGASASTPGGIVVGTNARAYNAITTLTDAASITINFALGNNFLVTLGGNRTLEAPTNATAGQTGEIYFIQDGTGGRTISFNAVYKFPSGSVPSATSTSGAVDLMVYSARSGTVVDAVMLKDFKRS